MRPPYSALVDGKDAVYTRLLKGDLKDSQAAVASMPLTDLIQCSHNKNKVYSTAH